MSYPGRPRVPRVGLSGILFGVLLLVQPGVGTGEDLARLRARVAQEGRVAVIVGVDVATQPEGDVGGAAAIADQRARIAAAQRRVLASLPATSLRLTRQFETIPYFALEVTAAALEVLTAHSGVVSVSEDGLVDPALADSVPLIGGDIAWGDGLTGSGQTVAIIDTGVESTHPFLRGKVVEEACFSNTSDCPNGATSQVGPGAAVPCGDPVTCNHGTRVAGIAAGEGPDFSGVARDASILAIQVFSQRTGTECEGAGEDPCYRASVSDVIAALERVYALRATYVIAAANLSLSAGKYASQATCDRESGGYKAVIDTLRSGGIATVAASGNHFYFDGIGLPACVSSAVSVGASTKSDTAASFSNSAPFLSLLAPGVDINSATLGGGFRVSFGTSLAAPHVAGAWAVLKQASPRASVDSILDLLTSTGTPITDPRNGVTTPRIDLDAALSALPGDCATELVGAGAAQRTGPVDLEAQRASWRTTPAGSEITTLEPYQRAYAHLDWRATGSGGPVAVTQRALLDGTLLCMCRHTAVAGQVYASSCNRSWRVLPGEHTLRWELDYDNAVGETDEGNNTAAATTTTAAARVDLVAERAFLRTGANSGSEITIATEDQRVFAHLTWSVVGATQPVTVQLRAWEGGFEWCRANYTTTSTRVTHWCVLGLPFLPGAHTLQWDLDFVDDVPETNESNNRAAADFVVTSLTPGATLAPTRTRTRTPTFATPTRTRTPSRTATVLTPTVTRTPSKTPTFPSPTPTATPRPTDPGLYPRGDANCSAAVTAPDVLAAALAVADHTTCANDDCDRDGQITAADIDCTVGCLFGACPPPATAARR